MSAESFPDAPALVEISGKSLNHRQLLSRIRETVENFHSFGIGRGDRIAILLPNDPEAALCSISVACTATSAPLNPASTPTELEWILRRMNPRGVIFDDSTARAAEVAARLGIPAIRLIRDSREVGSFHLDGPRGPAAQPGWAEPDDVALLVHTSGSTSSPKAAPLTHRNICCGAQNNIAQLGLSAGDRCLCVTSLFYTQGILVSVLSSLFAGGSVVVTPGYDPVRFFEWLDRLGPTWYAAPVAIHQSIVARAAQHSEIVERSRLRVIRSSSAPASAELTARVETLFRALMLNSYGLTETSSTIVGERLPPTERRPGSVGTPLGCEIGIADADGMLQPRGTIGEVVVRGPAVLRAYEADPQVNRDSFFGEWLRTGDLGRVDEDGYLFLTGRIKEIINRGGEKISPTEIDQVLTAHPDVASAVAFSIPDAVLGEEIGAAVVLRDGARPELEAELREFAAQRLGPSKIPRRFVFLDEIPKAQTGKFLRIGLAEKLGITQAAVRQQSPGGDSAPKDPLTMVMLHLWEDVLGRAPIGVEDDFFDLGGDSLLGARLLSRVEQTFGQRLTLATFLTAPTVAKMTLHLTRSPERGYDFGASKIIPIRTSGSLPPLFIVHPHPLFRDLILALPAEQPVYGLTGPDPALLTAPFQLHEIAAQQVEAIRQFQPRGPYALMGWCADGVVAYEMARMFGASGEEVPMVALVDAFNPARWMRESGWGARGNRILFHLENLSTLNFARGAAYIRDRLKMLRRRVRRAAWRAAYRLQLVTERRVGDRLRILEQMISVAISHYVPPPYAGRVLLLRAGDRPRGSYGDPARGWAGVAGDLHVADVPGNHTEMFAPPNAGVMASAMAAELKAWVDARQPEEFCEPV